MGQRFSGHYFVERGLAARQKVWLLPAAHRHQAQLPLTGTDRHSGRHGVS
jgi:hypothetical protein